MADDPKPGILRNLRIKRVSLVDVGANFDKKTGDGAHIMLYKRHDVNKDGPGLGSVHVDSPQWDDDDKDDYEKADLTGPGRRALPDSSFAAVWTDAQGKKHRKLPIHDAGHLAAARGRIDAANIPADVKAAARRKIEAATNHKEKNVKKSLLQKMLGLFGETDPAKRAAGIEEVNKALDDIKDDDVSKVAHDPSDPMCKCADCMDKRAKAFTGDKEVINSMIAKAVGDVEKAHKEEVAKLQKVAADAVAAVEVEKQARLTTEMTSILKGFKFVPMDMSKDVAKFIKMKATDPEMYESVMAMMKGTEAQLAKSALYGQFGTTRSGGKGDAWAQIEAKADAMVEKSTNGLTREQAIEKVSMDPSNMELMKQYRAEQQ